MSSKLGHLMRDIWIMIFLMCAFLYPVIIGNSFQGYLISLCAFLAGALAMLIVIRVGDFYIIKEE